jgi:hypothetical protein
MIDQPILGAVPCAVFIFGPPAVGKMTVGQALARRTGFALLHNHVVGDIVAPYFGSSTPEYAMLTKSITESLVSELVRAYPGVIFTRAHCFADALDAEMMKTLLGAIGETPRCFVELDAPLDIRLVRNQTENRLLHKPTKRDLVESDARVRRNDSRTFRPPTGVLPWSGRHLRLDNSALAPDEAAARICETFGLPERPAEGES